MKKSVLILPLFLAVLCIAVAAHADGDMRRLLSSNQTRMDSIFLEQPRSLRLDMIDYYDASLDTYVNDEKFDSNVRIDSLSDKFARFHTDTGVDIDFYLVVTPSDSLIIYVQNSPIARGDDMVGVYNLATGRLIQPVRPHYSDWIKGSTDRASDLKLIAYIPYVTSKAAINPTDAVITLTNTSISVPGIDEDVVAAFRPQLRYKWDGRRFALDTK